MLSTLLKPINILNTVGEKWLAHYERLGCKQIRDLLFHYPANTLDRRNMPPLHEVRGGEVITQIVIVHEHRPSKPYSKTPYKIICSNETGNLEVVYFRSNPEYLRKCFPIGRKVLLSGKAEIGINAINMPHPDIVTSPARLSELAMIEPVYPLTYGLSSNGVRKAIQEALAMLPEGKEWLPAEIIKQYNWPTWYQAIKTIHTPSYDSSSSSELSPYQDRLAFDEILANQIALKIMRNRNMAHKPALQFKGDLAAAFQQLLPFTLTDSQKSVIEEIASDQCSPRCMVRILQGDVGSGKTVVAITGILNAIETGKQAVLLVPTEILAKQHYQTLQRYFIPLGLHVVCLLGSDTPKQKEEKLQAIKQGVCQLVVGTHAVFQEQVDFLDLGFAVIDEQHRFGVEQRAALMRKGQYIDLLMMSATPIPRTLSMIAYGDLDVSSIKQKPSDRLPINTSILYADKIDELSNKLAINIHNGTKAYWICPLVDESEKINLVNVTARYEALNQLMPGMVGLVHGQMKIAERDKVMAEFVAGKIRVLVATTVIEVGVDVPDATIMVIEHAERFGLAQLHQLRGRVGRGNQQSQCVLLYKAPISKVAKQRLQIMRSSNDGFYIAEQDLLLRGGGEVLGTKQSGLPEFRNYDLFKHRHLLDLANNISKRILEEDEGLTKHHNVLRDLLLLYGYDGKLYQS